jgi:hypothetical protein
MAHGMPFWRGGLYSLDRAQTEFTLVLLVVALFVYRIVVICFATDTNGKPSSSRRLTAAQMSKLHSTLQLNRAD